MKTKLIITIDTEEDNWGVYRSEGHTVRNISQVPRLQALFDRYGAKPTYLVNWPVIMDQAACRIFKEIKLSGRCEIGSHCHPWNTPPIEEALNPSNSMMCNLPERLVKAKMANLAAATSERLDVTPTSFRAGRWALGRFVAEALIENGYTVDSSVSPAVDWRDDFGPNYTTADIKPYRFSPEDMLTPNGNGPLLEIPASVGFYQHHDAVLRKLRHALITSSLSRLHLIGILERLRLMNFRWLSPELTSAADMIKLARAMIAKGCPILNLSFHSTTLMPGMSPYVRSDTDLDSFLLRIEKMLEFAVQNDIEFSTLTEQANDG